RALPSRYTPGNSNGSERGSRTYRAASERRCVGLGWRYEADTSPKESNPVRNGGILILRLPDQVIERNMVVWPCTEINFSVGLSPPCSMRYSRRAYDYPRSPRHSRSRCFGV